MCIPSRVVCSTFAGAAVSGALQPQRWWCLGTKSLHLGVYNFLLWAPPNQLPNRCRYYGKSVPYGKDVRKHMGYLSAEQVGAGRGGAV